MTDVTPHPKPEHVRGNKARRIVDHKAIVRAKLMHPDCAACGMPGSNGHHVLPKDKGGDDLVENIVNICGSGTSRCHGAHHGNPYVVPRDSLLALIYEGSAEHDERRDAEWVNRRIGRTLFRDRHDVIRYIIDKLGFVAGQDYLWRVYYVEPSSTRLVVR